MNKNKKITRLQKELKMFSLSKNEKFEISHKGTIHNILIKKGLYYSKTTLLQKGLKKFLTK
jgi:hypothetical protein